MSTPHPRPTIGAKIKKFAKRTLLTILGVFAALIVIGLIVGPSEDEDPVAEPTATVEATPEEEATEEATEEAAEEATEDEAAEEVSEEPVDETPEATAEEEAAPEPEPEPEPEPVTLEDALASVAPDATLDATLADEMGTMVSFDISDNFTTGMMRSVAHADILDIVEALANADEDYGVGIQVTGDVVLVDNLGNDVNRMGIHTNWKRETIEQINWENKNSLDVERAADIYTRHPALD